MVVNPVVRHLCRMASPLPANPKRDQFVTPERSVFGTRLPRPTGVGRHLLIVLVVTAVALAVAVAFAEQLDGPSAAELKTPAQTPASALR
jgi:hypothetical protein